MFTLKPDYETSKKRMDAFWNREILDRPVVQFVLYKPRQDQQEPPHTGDASDLIAALDAEYLAQRQLVELNNQLFLGDTLPVACPALDPAVMAAYYGCPFKVGENGLWWCEPLGWKSADNGELSFHWESPWLEKTHELTAALLSAGHEQFITGMSNWLTGADCLAAILGAEQLGAALVTDPFRIKRHLDTLAGDFERLFTEIHAELTKAGQPATTWVPLAADGKYYVIANDFSGLVSNGMYRDFFLDDVKRKSHFLDHSLYHLDGPGALRHLDTILEVKELDGVQFVTPPGERTFTRWQQVYRRIQDAGKCVQVTCDLSEVTEIPRALKPEGLFLNVCNVTNEDEARALIHYLEQWPLSSYRAD